MYRDNNKLVTIYVKSKFKENISNKTKSLTFEPMDVSTSDIIL